jgi:F-type H+-transporting ATPase subunit b
MHIDWFVFFAQIVNFLILVFLLKWLLYGRIIKAMDEREAKIATTYEEGQTMRTHAQEALESYDHKLREIQETRDAMMQQAAAEADTHRKELMGKAREEIDQIRLRWQETIGREKTSFLNHLRQRAGKEVYAAASRILKDLANEDMEKSIMTLFIQMVKSMDDKESAMIRDAIKQSATGVIVQSAFDITADMRNQLNQIIQGYGGAQDAVQYETLPEIVSGIEMRTDGYKLAWSLNDYLETLEDSFSHALQEEAREKA